MSIHLPPWSNYFLKLVTVPQIVKKLPSFYGTSRFITRALHFSLSWAMWTPFALFHRILKILLILFSHLYLDLGDCLFLHIFAAHVRGPCHAHLISDFVTRIVRCIWWVKLMKIFIMQSSPVSCYLGPPIVKYLTQHPILKQSKPTFFPQANFQTHIKQQEFRSFVHLKFYIRREQTGR